MNNIVPCHFTTSHPAAMAAAQLIIMNGLSMTDMKVAMKKWEMIYKEIDEEGHEAV